ncbi:hypothetical protein Tco_0892503 [Tanacetum coccineum]|uniref:Uncharacterized protein n=1 Tax=Tanacetum coccineum TaxID=301880 RepID=A0ABQ5C630_9ASTR
MRQAEGMGRPVHHGKRIRSYSRLLCSINAQWKGMLVGSEKLKTDFAGLVNKKDMGISGVRFFFFSYLRYFELDEQIAPKSSRVILYTIPPDAPQLQASSPYGTLMTDALLARGLRKIKEQNKGFLGDHKVRLVVRAEAEKETKSSVVPGLISYFQLNEGHTAVNPAGSAF